MQKFGAEQTPFWHPSNNNNVKECSKTRSRNYLRKRPRIYVLQSLDWECIPFCKRKSQDQHNPHSSRFWNNAVRTRYHFDPESIPLYKCKYLGRNKRRFCIREDNLVRSCSLSAHIQTCRSTGSVQCRFQIRSHPRSGTRICSCPCSPQNWNFLGKVCRRIRRKVEMVRTRGCKCRFQDQCIGHRYHNLLYKQARSIFHWSCGCGRSYSRRFPDGCRPRSSSPMGRLGCICSGVPCSKGVKNLSHFRHRDQRVRFYVIG